MEEVKGYVEHIVFRNEDNGYTVFDLNNEDGELTCVGTFHYISEGELLKLTGEYVTHALYGVQLQVQTSEVCEPEDLVSIERYLGSGAIKGLGAALAGRIVRRFREDTFRIIEEEPERLAEIKGISERKAREIAEQIEEKKDVRRAMNLATSTCLTADKKWATVAKLSSLIPRPSILSTLAKSAHSLTLWKSGPILKIALSTTSKRPLN